MTVTINRLLALALALGLSACASSPKEEHSELRMKRASRANVQLGVAYMREGNLEIAEGKLQKVLQSEHKSK